MATNKVQTGLRLQEAIYEKAKFLAKKEQRSLNNFMEHAILRYIEDYENANGLIYIFPED